MLSQLIYLSSFFFFFLVASHKSGRSIRFSHAFWRHLPSEDHSSSGGFYGSPIYGVQNSVHSVQSILTSESLGVGWEECRRLRHEYQVTALATKFHAFPRSSPYESRTRTLGTVGIALVIVFLIALWRLCLAFHLLL